MSDMCDTKVQYTIISDLSPEEDRVLFAQFPPDKNRYIKVADLVNSSWQSFFDDTRPIGIVKSNDSVAQLEAHDIAVLGYEQSESEMLTTYYVVQDLSVIEPRDLDIVYDRFHKQPIYILETDRCILREHTLDDYDAIRDLYQDESMTEYMEPLFEPDEEKEYLGKYIELIYKMFGYGLWLIIDKISGEVIGRAGVEYKDSCIKDDQFELSYQVKKEWQGKGIATEVCGEIIKYTFNILGKSSIIARIDRGNTASIRVVDKLGFVPYEENVYIRRR